MLVPDITLHGTTAKGKKKLANISTSRASHSSGPVLNTRKITALKFEFRPSKKNTFLIRISIKKESRRAVFLLFIISYCMLSYTLLPSPRDTLELLGQILIQRNIRYRLNTSLFNFDARKGLTVKIHIILVCTQQQWALQVTPVLFCS